MGNGLRIVGLAVGPHSHTLESLLPPAPGSPSSWLPASHQERGLRADTPGGGHDVLGFGLALGWPSPGASGCHLPSLQQPLPPH